MNDFRLYKGLDPSPYLMHYGKGHDQGGHSGRYPWGSGKNPYQRQNNGAFIVNINDLNRRMTTGERPKELEKEHIIPKGTAIYRTVANKNEEPYDGMYISYLDADRNLYKAGFVRLTANSEEPVYENKYVLTDDLKVPSKQDLQKMVCDVVRGNKAYVKNVVDNWTAMAFDLNSPEAYDAATASADTVENFYNILGQFSNRKLNKYKENEVDRVMKMPVDEAFYYAATTFGVDKPLRQEVLKKASEKGYNAIVDEYGVTDGADPLIILDKNVLKKVESKKVAAKDEEYYRHRENASRMMKRAYDHRGDYNFAKRELNDLLSMAEKDGTYTKNEISQAKALLTSIQKEEEALKPFAEENDRAFREYIVSGAKDKAIEAKWKEANELLKKEQEKYREALKQKDK